jgi:hypothetical protein
MSCFHRIAFTHWWSGAWKVTRLESLVQSRISEGLAKGSKSAVACRTAAAPRCHAYGSGADECQIEAAFGEATRIARNQKAIAMEKRAGQLRGILSPKSGWPGRARVPTTSLLALPSSAARSKAPSGQSLKKTVPPERGGAVSRD